MDKMDDVSKQAARGAGGATVYDVARAAGVSAMTVSRVINGNTHVSEATRDKVLAAVASLKYQVNHAARAARIGTLRVGLLYSNPSAAFLSWRRWLKLHGQPQLEPRRWIYLNYTCLLYTSPSPRDS